MVKGLYRHSDGFVMVLYEKKSMVLPTSAYQEHGIKPILEDLPSHAEWVEWHRIHGRERMTQAEWEAWLRCRKRDPNLP